MKTKHTKGEWVLIQHNASPVIHFGDYWLRVGSIDQPADHICFVRSNERFIKHQEQLANAKLIAAAPELLEACQKFIELFSESDMKPEDECHELLQIIEQAIKKATA